MRIHGNTPDEKFKSVEKALERIGRKASRGKVTPNTFVAPLSFYAEELPEDGVVARYLFPIKGQLIKAVTRFPTLQVKKESEKESVGLEINVYGFQAKLQRSIYVNTKVKEDVIDFHIEPGDFMEVVTQKAPVWLAFAYKTYPSHEEMKDERVQEDSRIEPGLEAIQEGNEEG